MFQIIISRQAFDDVSNIKEYIARKLENPVSANSLYEKIRFKILLLGDFPERFAKIVINKTVYHRMPVERFNIYYRVDNSNHKVIIARVLYGGTNIDQVAIIN